MEVSIKARNLGQSWTFLKQDAKAYYELSQAIIAVTAFTALIGYVVGIEQLVVGIIKLGIFGFVVAVIVSFVLDILGALASLISSNVSALFYGIRSVVLTSSAKVASAVTSDWKVTVGVSIAVIIGYKITLNLYSYFNQPLPEPEKSK